MGERTDSNYTLSREQHGVRKTYSTVEDGEKREMGKIGRGGVKKGKKL